MRVLVTGGTGFIGSHLVQRLLARGDDVTVLSRDPASKTRRSPASRVLAWNPESGPPPSSALSSIDAVVNLLGESIAKGRWSDAKKQRILESRTIGTRNLVAGLASASPRPKVLVSGSAIGYYGDRGDEPLDETSAPGEGFLARVAKDWESEALAAKDLGSRVVLIRTGIVLARDGGALQSMLLPFRLGLGGPVASGKQWMSWISIQDFCSLILHAIDRPAVEGPVNGTAPKPVQNRDFAGALGRVLGRPAFLPTPAFALRLLLGEMADPLLIQGQRVLPKRAMDSGFRFAHPEIDGALTSVLS